MSEYELEKLREDIQNVARLYSEKRSDVSEILNCILEGKEPSVDIVEHRYVKWTHNGINFIYDTLTTLVEYQGEDDEWHTVEDIRYEDD